jgi:hypothetical protein
MPDSSIELVESFAAEVAAQDSCIDRGDSASGNAHAQRYVSAARTLLDGGDDSVDAFTKLLAHSNPSVRVMAAAFLLKNRTKQAVEVLTVAAEGSGRAALGAQMTLDRFARGILEINA